VGGSLPAARRAPGPPRGPRAACGKGCICPSSHGRNETGSRRGSPLRGAGKVVGGARRPAGRLAYGQRRQPTQSQRGLHGERRQLALASATPRRVRRGSPRWRHTARSPPSGAAALKVSPPRSC
jgi:hypothetical protein